MKTYYIHVMAHGTPLWFSVDARDQKEAMRMLDAYEAGYSKSAGSRYRFEIESISIRKVRKITYHPLVLE